MKNKRDSSDDLKEPQLHLPLRRNNQKHQTLTPPLPVLQRPRRPLLRGEAYSLDVMGQNLMKEFPWRGGVVYAGIFCFISNHEITGRSLLV